MRNCSSPPPRQSGERPGNCGNRRKTACQAKKKAGGPRKEGLYVLSRREVGKMLLGKKESAVPGRDSAGKSQGLLPGLSKKISQAEHFSMVEIGLETR